MMVRTQTKSAYSKGDSSPSLLPPPIHFGKHFREMVIDFQLPYDIWWLYDHDLVGLIDKLSHKADVCDKCFLLSLFCSNMLVMSLLVV